MPVSSTGGSVEIASSPSFAGDGAATGDRVESSVSELGTSTTTGLRVPCC